MQAFLNEIKPFFHVNIAKNDDGTFKETTLEDGTKALIIEETGHHLDSRKVRDALKRLVKQEAPDLFDKVEAHTGETFYKSTERTPPFVIYMLAAGLISVEDYCNKIIEAPKDAKVVANYIPEAKFKDKLYEAYAIWDKATASSIVDFNTKTTSDFKFTKPSDEQLKVLDTILPTYGQPKFTDIVKEFNNLASSGTQIQALTKALDMSKAEIEQKAKEYADQIATLSKELTTKAFKDVTVSATGEVPNGTVVMKEAKSLFPSITADFMVPVWEWDGPHPDVPAIDEDYIFREDLLVNALYAILSNQRMYLQGDTGSGKTTLIEQIAAHLNWPFGRINFDSEITRMDLIGRDTLKEGKTEFIDGFLPRYMSGPYILCFDEIDFCRPDVAYVMQAALEGNSLIITEDGGRRVAPHPMMRMFGTGNTVGQGDEKGMYQGARPQSIAFLDRFTVWAKVDYLSQDERTGLLKKRVPTLKKDEVATIIKYTEEHLNAFKEARVLQPISPRGMIAVGKAVAHFNNIYPTAKNNIHKALQMVVLDRATNADHITLKGLVDRVAKS